MNNVIWRESGQADLLGEFSPQELRVIADETEHQQKMTKAGYVLVNGMWCKTPAQRAAFAIDGTGWAEAAFEPARHQPSWPDLGYVLQTDGAWRRPVTCIYGNDECPIC